MPKPIPSSLAESMPSHQNGSPASEEVLRVLGGTGLPDDSNITRLSDDTASSHEIVSLSWEVANDAYESTIQLYNELIPGAEAPDMRDFVEAGVDFAKLQVGYEAYEAAGMKPELVFAPINAGVDFWKRLYGSLRMWQDTHLPTDARCKLQKQDNGDGLYVAAIVANNWEPLNTIALNSSSMGKSTRATGKIAWKALVVPTASAGEGGLAVNTSFDTTRYSDEFVRQAATLSMQVPPNGADSHMPVGAYLMMEAIHIYKDMPLLEDYMWTWNAGTFKNAQVRLQAPASLWLPTYGQVRVYSDRVDHSDDRIGARLPVWG